ncbi:hypothetical protein ACU4GR_11965 [Methylobacterium oryzae CBMB20]
MVADVAVREGVRAPGEEIGGRRDPGRGRHPDRAASCASGSRPPAWMP